MTKDDIKQKAYEFFEFPTDNKDHVTTCSAILFAYECVKDALNNDKPAKNLLYFSQVIEL